MDFSDTANAENNFEQFIMSQTVTHSNKYANKFEEL